MAYKHGVYTSEVATSMVAPITGTAGLQVIVGTAPVNMLKDPAAAVNVPLLVSSYKEAVEAICLTSPTTPSASASAQISALWVSRPWC